MWKGKTIVFPFHISTNPNVSTASSLFNLYPNPVATQITFSTTMNVDDIGTLQIVSTDGKVLIENGDKNGPGF